MLDKLLKRKNIVEFFKYAIVGFSGIFVNLFYLYTLTESLQFYYLTSEVFAFAVATLSNFVFNKVWTFKEKMKTYFFVKGAKFFLVASIALVVNLSFLWFFTEALGVYYILSQILASGFTLIVNFLGNKFWTFR
ncbi:MAG: GtrA family protein [Nanoarchaeota archaeon]|nr:GtrA family protein [Nanoarchaeota archaeon]